MISKCFELVLLDQLTRPASVTGRTSSSWLARSPLKLDNDEDQLVCENTHSFYPILVISNDIWSSTIWGIITASLCNFLETRWCFLGQISCILSMFWLQALSCDRVLFLSFLTSHFHFSLRIGQSTAARLLSVLWLKERINSCNWPTTVVDSNSVHLHPEEVTRLLTVFAQLDQFHHYLVQNWWE